MYTTTLERYRGIGATSQVHPPDDSSSESSAAAATAAAAAAADVELPPSPRSCCQPAAAAEAAAAAAATSARASTPSVAAVDEAPQTLLTRVKAGLSCSFAAVSNAGRGA